MVRIINGEVVSADPSRRNSRSNSSHTTPITASLSSAASPMLPPLTLPSSAVSSASSNQSSHHTTPRHSSSTPDTPSPMLAASTHHTSPPPLGLGVQHTNPYLSATAYGGAPLTSGHGFHDGSSPPVTAHDLGLAHAQAQAYAAAYYLHGLLGPGFILGHAQQPEQPQLSPQPAFQPSPLQPSPPTPTSVTPLSATAPNSPPQPSRSLSNSSSSCPSPMLTSTSERRKSKPHIQFIPPTHTATPTGLVVPVAPPPSLALDGNSHPRSSNLHSTNSSSARVSHAFNLFGLPPLFVYEIRIPPHVYLLTGLILYLIGPPALIPLVACFFFYRWHLQQKNSHSNHHNAGVHPPLSGANSAAATSKAAAIAAGHASMNRHPSGVPKAVPSPLITQRRNPNIHSLYDSQ